MRERGRPRWRMPRIPLVIALTCYAGVLVLLYPSAASWLSAYEQSSMIDEYTAGTTAGGPADREQRLRDARLYNEQLFGSASVGANERVPLADAGHGSSGYPDQLRSDGTSVMARLKIPAIDADLPVYHGTSEAVLGTGIGHLEGTALPVGGTGTHSVLTGHRGLASAELFTRLNEVGIGDTVTIEVLGDVLLYRVIDTQIVEPDRTQTLYPVVGDDLVTLVTCTPLGINSHRILVTAERVLPTPPKDIAAAGGSPGGPGSPWWALAATGALGALAVYVRRAGVHQARPGDSLEPWLTTTPHPPN